MNFFVTGGSRGIGAELVRVACHAGHNVAFGYRREQGAAEEVISAATAEASSGRCLAYQLDVADAAAVERVGDQVLGDLDSISVVVNCAGINRDNLLVAMSDEEWADVLATNLNGPFYVSRHFLPGMLSARFGRVINISSIQARGARGQCNYAASKAGLEGLTFSLAKEYGRRGVTANVIAPGFFDTDMTRDGLPEAAREYWRAHCPAPKGRMGKVDEIAKAVLFLASRDAAYINGQVLRLGGGLDWLP